MYSYPLNVAGILPYNQRSKVATLATWQADMMPFFTCCQWQKDKDDSLSCQKYKYFRTSQDCSAYQPPGFAAVFGDPHFLTFDGKNYTFNGHGEFSLVHADNEKAKLNIQGRFESRRREHFSDIEVRGTFLSGVAARDNVSSTVEFHLRPLVARWQYQMYLIVDNEYIYFWDETMRTQNFKGERSQCRGIFTPFFLHREFEIEIYMYEFNDNVCVFVFGKGVSIYQPTGYYNMSKIVAMFDSGAGVEVSVVHEQLVLNVFLPVEFVVSLGNVSFFFFFSLNFNSFYIYQSSRSRIHNFLFFFIFSFWQNITEGLLGSWDNVMDNDLSVGDERTFFETDEQIYRGFGNKRKFRGVS